MRRQHYHRTDISIIRPAPLVCPSWACGPCRLPNTSFSASLIKKMQFPSFICLSLSPSSLLHKPSRTSACTCASSTPTGVPRLLLCLLIASSIPFVDTLCSYSTLYTLHSIHPTVHSSSCDLSNTLSTSFRGYFDKAELIWNFGGWSWRVATLVTLRSEIDRGTGQPEHRGCHTSKRIIYHFSLSCHIVRLRNTFARQSVSSSSE